MTTFYFKDRKFREFMQEVVDSVDATEFCVAVFLCQLFKIDDTYRDNVFIDEKRPFSECPKDCLCKRSREISELDVLSNPYHPFYGSSDVV